MTVGRDHETGNIVVVSLRIPRDGVLLARGGGGSASEGLVERLVWDNSCWIVCTGVKADARWLVKTLQQYMMRSSATRSVHATKQALLSFMGYDRSQEWHDGVGPVVVERDDEDDNGEVKWSRPLGIQTILISTRAAPHSTFLDPSGLQEQQQVPSRQQQ